MKTVSKAGRSLMINEPFYGYYLLNLNKKFSEDLPTAGVYREGINMALAINKDFWMNLSENHRLGLLKHELLHICFQHLDLASSYSDHSLFNIAADMEINQYIKSDNLPEGGITLTTFPTIKLESFKGTHYYYEKLKQDLSLPKNPQPGQNNKQSESGNGNNENNSGDNKQNQNSNSKQNGNNSSKKYRDEVLDKMHQQSQDLHKSWEWYKNLSSAEKKLVKQQVDHLLKESAKTAKKSVGSVPSEMKNYIDDLFTVKEPAFNWKAYFRRFLGNSMEIYTKKSKRKLSKRFIENPGLKIKKKKHILVAIDTSGSIAKNELAEFFGEIYHIWKCGSEVTIIECDARIGDIYKYNGKFRGHISGGGGTSFDPVVKYFNDHSNKFTTCVYFTDGYASTPRKPNKQMAWVISSNGKSDYAELPGVVINIPKES